MTVVSIPPSNGLTYHVAVRLYGPRQIPPTTVSSAIGVHPKVYVVRSGDNVSPALPQVDHVLRPVNLSFSIHLHLLIPPSPKLTAFLDEKLTFDDVWLFYWLNKPSMAKFKFHIEVSY